MLNSHSRAHQALKALLPELRLHFPKAPPRLWQRFEERLTSHFDEFFEKLFELYGDRWDFFYHLMKICESAAAYTLKRKPALRKRDQSREAHPDWYQDEKTLGGLCYVDLYSGDLPRMKEQIPYFQELGLTYLHLMPLFRCPPGENDGGYAVSSYREVNPALGTNRDLQELIDALQEAGISVVLDFVFNHTADDHPWALKAQEGDPEYREHYFIFPDRTEPDQYDASLREIFPEVRRGNFTYREKEDFWVWTTFNNYQWDLNYHNPVTFRHMAEEMLSLANLGVDVLRLDALAFVWKEKGTPCENLKKAHTLIQAFNLVARLSAPSLTFKSEAIVHPEEVAKYIGLHESQLSYHPTMMALLWESLATRKVSLLRHSMQKRFALPRGCSWVNYVRCHDDIGWTFADEDAAELGINGYDHRRFLNSFYTGSFPGSFARGVPFQLNPETGDCRISGSCASLCGLEKALHEKNPRETDLAARRILLIHSVILSAGGVPLIYLNDEVGVLNDYTYRDDPGKADDSRWVHRPHRAAALYRDRQKSGTTAQKIFQGLTTMIRVRKEEPALGGQETDFLHPGSEHVLAYLRHRGDHRLLILANFSENPQRIPFNFLRVNGPGYHFMDLLSGKNLTPEKDLSLGPYEIFWLKPQGESD